MPKYGVHHIVLDNAIKGLKASQTEVVYDTLAQNYDIAMLGAIGPDLFFWASDYTFVQIYQGIDEIITVYDDAVKPFREIREAVGNEIDKVVQDLFPKTYGIIKTVMDNLEYTVNLFNTTVATGMLSGALGGINLLTETASLPTLVAGIFNLFTPPRQFNKGEKEWYWFDMLHYRNTGDFARNLVENAHTDRQRAYAFGYLSHIATDLVGHPYVNQIVGGPFRLHVQRHATVENFIDSRMFDEQYGESVNQTLIKRLGLKGKGHEHLPDDICKLIESAFQNTYSVDRPRFLTAKQIQEAYENFYKMLGYMERFDIPYPTEPFLDVNRILSEKLKDLLEPPPSWPSSPTSSCSFEDIMGFGTTPNSKQCYDAFFRQLERYFEYIGKLLEWLFETAMDLVDYLLVSWAAMPAKELLAILYGIQEALYKMYQTLRSGLALTGLIYPHPKDLENAHGRNLTTTFQKCTRHRLETYPLQTNIIVSHLVCPHFNLETPFTTPDFNLVESADVTPDDFISNSNVPFDRNVFLSYAGADVQITSQLHVQQKRVGNATDLTKWMITNARDSSAVDYDAVFTNFDLDADRGYFYRTWKGDISADKVQHLIFI